MLRLGATILAAATASAILAAQSASAGSVFVIAMENHNFTQPTNQTSPQQIFGNPAAPYQNSLITPGNPNAAQVSYAVSYHNAGKNVHPSEPNYVWAEAGTDFGVHTDNEPRLFNNNIFPFIHITAQLNAAGITWKNYQEDVQLSASPTNNVSGTNGPTNPWNGSMQFDYAVKHNPMAFFPDTALQNVYPLDQLLIDLSNNTVGRYNWITPDQFNDAHTSLKGGFTYNGTLYTGDAANIAQGDNFLSMIVPQIMASAAYKDNGAIIIWWDESEGGDDATRTLTEIVISPLAKGNAYASSIEMNHSSDVKTMEELFGLPFINNIIPTAETNINGGYNNVATVNDLSDLFVDGAIPAAPSFSVTPGNFVDHHNGRITQTVRVTNNGSAPSPTPLWFVLNNLSPNATLLNAAGISSIAPWSSQYVGVTVAGDGTLRPHESKTVTLEFLNPSGGAITYDTRVLSATPAP